MESAQQWKLQEEHATARPGFVSRLEHDYACEQEDVMAVNLYEHSLMTSHCDNNEYKQLNG